MLFLHLLFGKKAFGQKEVELSPQNRFGKAAIDT